MIPRVIGSSSYRYTEACIGAICYCNFATERKIIHLTSICSTPTLDKALLSRYVYYIQMLELIGEKNAKIFFGLEFLEL